MKIDKTRFEMFWANPERYRLREIWKIQPIQPKVGTAARKRSFGMFRGICFHEMMDGLYQGRTIEQVSEKLLQEGFGNDEVESAAFLAKGARDAYADEKYLVHEAVFEYPIPDSPHVLVGRLDHLLDRDSEIVVGDWKTSRYRSQSELAKKGAEYCRGPQVDFYLLGATVLGYSPTGFIYRLVSSRNNEGDDSPRVQVKEFRTERTSRELRNFQRSVAMTCDIIETWKKNHDLQQPWPIFEERFPTGFESRFGLNMYPDYMPEGFEPKVEHLSVMEDQ